MKFLAAYLMLIFYLLLSITAYAATPDWLAHDLGMEKKVGGNWKKVEWKKNKAALDKIIEKCICRFVVPFTLPSGLTIVPGRDDMELTKERTDQGATIEDTIKGGKSPEYIKLPHEGVDIGSRISMDSGKTLGKLDNAKVTPMYPGGFIRDNQGPEQKIMCENNGFRLILVLDYDHVNAAAGIGNKWKPTPITGNIGILEGNNKWDSFDPDLTMKMRDKGNHIHLGIKGIYELTDELILAHNHQLQGMPVSKDEADFLKGRADFFNTILKKTTGTFDKNAIGPCGSGNISEGTKGYE